MKTINKAAFILACILIMNFGSMAQNVWINEIHYDNAGTDADEFIEIVLENPGSYTLSNFSIVLYNGNNGASYDTRTLDQYTAGTTIGNFKFYWFNYTAAGASIQNGAPDGLALAYQGTVVTGQFLSYEGTLTAVDGPASGMTSVDIGVSESSTTPVGFSLQLGGTGSNYPAFAWQTESAATPGNLNNNQNLGGTPDPEPSNYPTNFTATPSAFTINLNWTDAVGAQLPAAYLILASEEDNIEPPVDGYPEPNDPNLADGTGALNVDYGEQACQFANLQSNKQFYFKIFPYTNFGTNINYKTDGTPPSATATTPNAVIINYVNFNDTTFGSWTEKSIIGDTTWTVRGTYGVGGSCYANVTGYMGSGVYAQNEDWLISPSLNFNLYTNEELTFQTAMKYTGPALEPLISNNYDGVGNPNNFTWTPLTATLSPGNFTWTPSGIVNISGISGTNIHIAFKFTCSDTESATWEVDEILTSGILIVGMPEQNDNKDFTIFPNPSKGTLNIGFSDNSRKEVRITSMLGKDVFMATTNQNQLKLNLSDLSAGIYFIQVNYPGSDVQMTKKINIQ